MILRLVFSFFLLCLVTGNQQIEGTKKASRSYGDNFCPTCGEHQDQDYYYDDISSHHYSNGHQDYPNYHQEYSLLPHKVTQVEQGHYGYPDPYTNSLSPSNHHTEDYNADYLTDRDNTGFQVQHSPNYYHKESTEELICFTSSQIHRIIKSALEYVNHSPSEITLIIHKIEQDLKRLSGHNYIDFNHNGEFKNLIDKLDSKLIYKMVGQPSSETTINLLLDDEQSQFPISSEQQNECKEALKKLLLVAYNVFMELDLNPLCVEFLQKFIDHLDIGPDIKSMIHKIFDEKVKHMKIPISAHEAYHESRIPAPNIQMSEVHEVEEKIVPKLQAIKMPQFEEYVKQSHEYGIPQVEEYHVTKTHEYKEPHIEEYNLKQRAPHIPKITIQQVPDFPQITKIIENTHEYNVPEIDEYSIKHSHEYTKPYIKNPNQYRIPQIEDINIPHYPGFEGPHSEQYIKKIHQHSIPQIEGINIPQFPEFEIPHSEQYIEKIHEYNIPQVQKHITEKNEYRIPQIEEVNIQHIPEIQVPQIDEYSITQNHEYNIPYSEPYKKESHHYTIPQIEDINIPHFPGFEGPHSEQYIEKVNEYNIPQLQKHITEIHEHSIPVIEEVNIQHIPGNQVPQIDEYSIKQNYEYNKPYIKNPNQYRIPQIEDINIPHFPGFEGPHSEQYIEKINEYNIPQVQKHVTETHEYEGPLIEEVNIQHIPEIHEYNIPHSEQYIKKTHQHSIPQMQDINIPHFPGFEGPHSEQYIEKVNEYNIPQLQKHITEIHEHSIPVIEEVNIQHIPGNQVTQIDEYDIKQNHEYNIPYTKKPNQYRIPQIEDINMPHFPGFEGPHSEQYIEKINEYNIPQVQKHVTETHEYEGPLIEEVNIQHIPEIHEYNIPHSEQYIKKSHQHSIPQMQDINIPHFPGFDGPHSEQYIENINEYNIPQLQKHITETHEHSLPVIEEINIQHIPEIQVPNVEEYTIKQSNEYNIPHFGPYIKKTHHYPVPQILDMDNPHYPGFDRPYSEQYIEKSHDYRLPQFDDIDIPHMPEFEIPQIDEYNIKHSHGYMPKKHFMETHEHNIPQIQEINYPEEPEIEFPQDFELPRHIIKEVPILPQEVRKVFIKQLPTNDITNERQINRLERTIEVYHKHFTSDTYNMIRQLLWSQKRFSNPNIKDILIFLMDAQGTQEPWIKELLVIMSHYLLPDIKSGYINPTIIDVLLNIINNPDNQNNEYIFSLLRQFVEVKTSRVPFIVFHLIHLLQHDMLSWDDISNFLGMELLNPTQNGGQNRETNIMFIILEYLLKSPRYADDLVTLLRRAPQRVLSCRGATLLELLYNHNKIIIPPVLDSVFSILIHDVTHQLHVNELKLFLKQLGAMTYNDPRLFVPITALFKEYNLETINSHELPGDLFNIDLKEENDYRFSDNAQDGDNNFLAIIHWLENQGLLGPDQDKNEETINKMLKILEMGDSDVGVVELTYMLKKDKPIIYQPVYYVKYRLPIYKFLTTMNSMLTNNPQEYAENPMSLLQNVILTSNITEVSPSLRSYPKEEIFKLTFKDGDLVQAKILDEQNLSFNEQITYVHGLNMDITPEEILELNKVNEAKYTPEMRGNFPQKVDKIIEFPPVKYEDVQQKEVSEEKKHESILHYNLGRSNEKPILSLQEKDNAQPKSAN